MHNKSFQDNPETTKGDAVPIKNSSHRAFIEKLKKQVLSDAPSSGTGDADPGDNDACSEELMKELEAKFDELFAVLDDDD